MVNRANPNGPLRYEQIADLFNMGLSIPRIAMELNLKRGTVVNYISVARRHGLVPPLPTPSRQSRIDAYYVRLGRIGDITNKLPEPIFQRFLEATPPNGHLSETILAYILEKENQT